MSLAAAMPAAILPGAVPLVLAVPAAAAVLLALLPGGRLSAGVNAAASFLAFLGVLALAAHRPEPGPYILVDDLSVAFLLLTSFVAFTTSLFNIRYVAHEVETGRLPLARHRAYHALYQVLLFAMTLALISNNLGVMWVAIELATLSSVVVVGLYRTPEAIEAAWKYFILGSVGIALALFGTILVYMAAQPVVGEGQDGMVWSVLMTKVAAFDPAFLNLAFVFLLLGYGTKVGLTPLNAWLPDAHSEGPTPVSAVLSGLLLNVALYAVLRFKMLLSAHPAALAPGPLLMAAGLASLLMGGFMLYRRRDVKRMFSYSSVEHMGIIALAFGIGGPIANFAGLLHVAMHSLTKSAIFFVVGHAAQAKGSQQLSDITGLTTSHPLLGWALVFAVAAIAGLPPGGLFTSEFLLLTSTFAHLPWLGLVLAAGLFIAFAALMGKLAGLAFGEPSPDVVEVKVAKLPLLLHLALVLMAGIWLPPQIAAGLRQVAAMLG